MGKKQADIIINRWRVLPLFHTSGFTMSEFNEMCDCIYERSDRLVPVSYTHLDVYKRQP